MGRTLNLKDLAFGKSPFTDTVTVFNYQEANGMGWAGWGAQAFITPKACKVKSIKFYYRPWSYVSSVKLSAEIRAYGGTYPYGGSTGNAIITGEEVYQYGLDGGVFHSVTITFINNSFILSPNTPYCVHPVYNDSVYQTGESQIGMYSWDANPGHFCGWVDDGEGGMMSYSIDNWDMAGELKLLV